MGRYEFAPSWAESVKALVAQGEATRAAVEALGCASETAHALREGVTAIRMNNRAGN